jgi:hypothetical protein
MKLGTVLSAADANPLYCDFIPYFIKAWLTLFPTVNIVIVLVSESIPHGLTIYKHHIHLCKPLQGIHTAYQAQMIRLLYPRELTDEKDGILITDIDMIPLNAVYYQENIKALPNNLFVSYRDVLYPEQLAMCYNIASQETWANIIGPGSVETLLRKFYNQEYTGTPGQSGWYSDQEVLIKAYNAYTGPKLILKDELTEFKRLDREDKVFEDQKRLKEAIQTQKYSDYHCLRPYNKHKQINDFILNCVVPENFGLGNLSTP